VARDDDGGVLPISRVYYFDRSFAAARVSVFSRRRVLLRALLFKVRSGERRFDVLPPVMSPWDPFYSGGGGGGGDGHCLNTQ